MENILSMIIGCVAILFALLVVGFGIWLLTWGRKHAADKSSKITAIIVSILLILGGIVILGQDVIIMLSII